MRRSLLLALALVVVAPGCRPRVAPLAGVPTPEPLPRTSLPAVPHRFVIQWRYADPDVSMNGDGLVRFAPPDSARLDLFLGGGYGGGKAYLIGDTLDVPGARLIERFLPPAELLWATLGRLTVQGADTVLRVDGDTLRADIGHAPRWRAVFAADTLRRLERIDGDRLQEFVIRPNGREVRYEHTAPRRTLTITIVRADPAAPFDADIWR